MKKSILIRIVLLAVAAQSLVSCDRRSLEDSYVKTALIPVKIDWALSGIPVTDPSGGEYVHRVSIRFFPKDGSPAFDKYLESNVMEGEIEVPVGNYSVVVFNESIHDTYWGDAIYFTDTDKYSDFAANLVADDPGKHPLYTPLEGENLVVAPFRMASWSLDDFRVSKEAVTRTRTSTRTGTPTQMENELDDMINALTNIVMRPLTYNVKVIADVENLCSAQTIQGAMRGFAGKVYMASRQTAYAPTTYLFPLNGRKWSDGSKTNGTTERTFLSFGGLPQPSEYWLNLDMLFVTGEVFQPEEPFLYDVTEQVSSQTETEINTSIDIHMHINVDMSLPLVEGGVNVGDWDDETITLQ